MKRKKLNVQDIANYGYYQYVRASVDGVRGFLYYIDKKLTNEDKDYILSFRNTKLFYTQPQYAPEQKSNVIFLGDNCFK